MRRSNEGPAIRMSSWKRGLFNFCLAPLLAIHSVLGRSPSLAAATHPRIQRRWTHAIGLGGDVSDYSPFVSIAAAVLLGHACAFALPLEPTALLVAMGLALSLWSVVRLSWLQQHPAFSQVVPYVRPFQTVLFFVACFSFGWALQAFHRQVVHRDDILAWVSSEPRPFSGRVIFEQCDKVPETSWTEVPRGQERSHASQPKTEECLWRIRGRVEALETQSGWSSGTGRVELMMRSSTLPLPGERWRVSGRIRLPPDAGNPREFDRREYLRRIGISAVVDVVGAWREVDRASLVDFARRQLGALRWSVRERLLAYVPGKSSGLTLALILGWRDELDDDLHESFKASGLGHVLSISGLHVSLLMVTLLTLGRSVGLSTRRTGIVASASVCVYALLAGGAPTVVRSVILASLGGWGWLEGRRSAGLQGLAGAAIFLSTVDPASVTDLGAQLSFLGVAGLCLSSRAPRDQPLAFALRHWRATHGRPVRWPVRLASQFTEVLWTTTWVMLLTGPLVAYHFHCLTWGSWILNAWIGLPLAVALLAALVTALPLPSVWLASILGWLTSLALAPIIWGTEQVAAWFPPSSIAGPSTLELVVLYAAMSVVLVVSRERMLTRLLTLFLIGGLIHASIPRVYSAWPIRELMPQRTTISFIDVGHGNATLVQWPDHRTWLIDAGSALGDRRAANSISSVLWHEKVGRIEVVCLSHPDRDHFNALMLLLDRFTIDSVAMPSWFAETTDQSWRHTVAELRRRGIRVDWVATGDHFDFRSRRWLHSSELVQSPPTEMNVRVHHPPEPNSNDRRIESDNAGSLVLTLEAQGRTILLPGDMEGEGAEQVARAIGKVDWLAAPHHGSPHSSPEIWLALCRPQFLIVSSAKVPAWLSAELKPRSDRPESLAGSSDESRLPLPTNLRLRAYPIEVKTMVGSSLQLSSQDCVVLTTPELGRIKVDWPDEGAAERLSESETFRVRGWRAARKPLVWEAFDE